MGFSCNQLFKYGLMKYLPGHDGITEDVLLVAALAQVSLLSLENFTTLPYLQHLIKGRSDQALIEKILAMSIKLRFLDDRTDLLRVHDRKSILIGKYFEDDVHIDAGLGIRAALNKLVHHMKISVTVEQRNTTVLKLINKTHPTDEKVIPHGHHSGMRVKISVEGMYKDKNWRFEIDLYSLLNEILRSLDSAKGLT